MALRRFLSCSRALLISIRFALSASVNPAQTNKPSVKVLIAPHGVNHSIQRMGYAVGRALVQRAERTAHQLCDRKAASDLPFYRIFYCNIGNPRSVRQPPTMYVRQVLFAFVPPQLIDTTDLPFYFVDRVRMYLDILHSECSYIKNLGIHFLRDRVVNAITKRNEVKPSLEDIFLTSGASEAVKTLIQRLVPDSNGSIWISVSQYPLQYAAITALDRAQVSDSLDEENSWVLI